ncbi:MAG: sugar phosphate isomerase/epimerase [Alicyclobacillus sp.]|nr:sugar phosphate isomerase/epimerase [Alicyclobacillus sp.]
MKIGMNLLLWTDRPTFGEHRTLIPTLKSWGFDGVEFPIASMSSSDILNFARLCDDLGMGRTAILALDAGEADPASSDARLRQAANDEIRRTADKAKVLGADIIVGPLFQGLGRFTGQAPTRDEWNYAVETIRQAASYAATMSISLALEPLNRFEMYMVNTMSDGALFVEEVGLRNVGLLADTHHGNIEEEDVARAWEKVGNYIYHVHISENHRGIPGSGHAIPLSIFETLQKIRYAGWLTIEAFGNRVPGLISRLHLWRTLAQREEDIARLGIDFIRRNLRTPSQ